MRSLVKLYVVLCSMTMTVAMASSSCGPCPSSLRTALVDLYSSTAGKYWTHADNWTRTDVDCTAWYGVSMITTNAKENDSFTLLSSSPSSSSSSSTSTCRVSLSLPSNALSGTLPNSLWSAANWAAIELGDNPQLYGRIPSDLSFLAAARARLWIFGTRLSGALPRAVRLGERSSLFASESALDGLIPEHVELGVSATLDVSNTGVSGVLPDPLVVPADAQFLANGASRLSGELPELVLAEASHVGLQATMVSGTLPSTLTVPPSAVLYLSGTKLSGELPELELGRFSQVFLSATAVSGTMPAVMRLPYAVLALTRSLVSGTLSELVLSGEAQLALERTKISGTIPHVWDVQPRTNLTLAMSGLRLSGTLPTAMSKMENLKLNIATTDVSGSIPETVAAVILELDAPTTLLDGALPSFPRAVRINLANAFVEGTVPTIAGGGMGELVLDTTFVSGTLPPELFDGRLVKLQLSNTLVTSSIPSVIRNNGRGFETVIASASNLWGSIPTSLCSHTHMRQLGLSNNAGLSGALPSCLGTHIERMEVGGTGITSVEFGVWSSPALRLLSLGPSPATLDVSNIDSPMCRGLRTGQTVHSLDISAQASDLPAAADAPTLLQYMHCLLFGTRVERISLRNIKMGVDACVEQGAVAVSERTHSFPCNLMYPSQNLVVLDLANTGLRGLSIFVPEEMGEVIEANSLFPSLDTLDVSGNRELMGPVPDGMFMLHALDISNTSYDVCSSRPLFGSTRLRQLSLVGLHAPWSRCRPMVEPAKTALIEPTGQFASDATRGGVQCPLWRMTNTAQAAIRTDSTFLDFYRCTCPELRYFGRDGEYEFEHNSVAWEEYRSEQYDPDTFQCWPCPGADGEQEVLQCDMTAGPVSPPRHSIVGPRYPVYVTQTALGSATFMPERWRLVHAALLTCQHPDVCNTGEPDEDEYSCRQGHDVRSLLCARCEAGYFRSGVLCTACFEGAEVVVPALLVVAGVGFVAFLSVKRFGKPGNTVSLLFFWFQLSDILSRVNDQMVASVSSGSAQTTSTFEQVFNKLGSFHPFAIECVNRGFGFVELSWSLLLSPALLLVAYGLAFLVVSVLHAPRRDFATLVATWKRYPRWTSAAAYTWMLMLFPVLKRATEVLVCDHPEAHGAAAGQVDVSFLRAAPWIACDSAKHKSLIAVSVVSMLAFVLPTYAFLLVVLRAMHTSGDEPAAFGYELMARGAGMEEGEEEEEAREDDNGSAWDNVLAFLSVSVRGDCWYWPLVIVGRNLLLALTLGTVDFQSPSLPLAVFSLMLVSLLAHIHFKPYVRVQDNALESLVLLCALFRYMVTMLISLKTLNGDDVPHLGSVLSVLVYISAFAVLTDPHVHWRKRASQLWARCV